MSKLRAIVSYLSYSGNTKEVAELIAQRLQKEQIEVEMNRIGMDPVFQPDKYDLVFLGTFTWAKGKTPDEVKDLVWEIGYKPDNIAVFGTGDTQFGGDDLFCNAAVKLAKFYNSKWEPLKIEQSPRGRQESKVIEWVEGVLQDATCIAK